MEEDLLRWQREQNVLRARVQLEDCVNWSLDGHNTLRLVGGVDISFFPEHPHPSHGSHEPRGSHTDKQQQGQQKLAGLASMVVLSYPDLKLVYEDYEPIAAFDCPYVPGYLAFREMPFYLTLMERVSKSQYNPQVVLVDGCGLMHPRKFGSACHLGVVAGIPTIGVAKNVYAVDGLDRLEIESAFDQECEPQCKEHPALLREQQALPQENMMRALRECVARGVHSLSGAGRTVTLPTGHRMLSLRGASDGELLGVGLAARSTKKPIYVSAGHRVSLVTAVCLVSLCCRHKNPEPLRLADLRSRDWVRRMVG